MTCEHKQLSWEAEGGICTECGVLVTSAPPSHGEVRRFIVSKRGMESIDMGAENPVFVSPNEALVVNASDFDAERAKVASLEREVTRLRGVMQQKNDALSATWAERDKLRADLVSPVSGETWERLARGHEAVAKLRGDEIERLADERDEARKVITRIANDPWGSTNSFNDRRQWCRDYLDRFPALQPLDGGSGT